MRAGELRHRADVLALDVDLSAKCLGKAWLGILAKESAEPSFPSGLRNPAKIDVRARYSSALAQGRYLRHGIRLFHITSVRDPLGNRAELRVTGEELVGQPGQYLSADGVPRCCRVHLTHEAPYRDELGQVVSYMTRAEVAIIEVGRPQAGDQLRVEGDLYVVANYADDTDDGVVRGLWLQPVE
ncbi:head-tail adaptor protein [Ectopseudomonas mendocina]|uniref:hypothetical protein n=1 Tax=Ectopseudomonas mendocina TaxID=300 RepID=UPI00376EA443